MAWQLDLEELTTGELRTLAKAVGVKDIRELGALATGAIPPDWVPAIAWLVKHKQDPTFTMEQAENVPMRELNALLEGLDPNAKAAEAATSSTPTTPKSSTSTRAQSRRKASGV